MEITKDARLPLSGVRIIAWSLRQTAPSATSLLADMGAEVIKVETPQGGDSHRGIRKDGNNWLTLSHGLSYGFEMINRNKKSITIDLSQEEGKKILYALVAKSDVFVQNYRYGAAKRLEIDYEVLKKYNPSLIYANCTGYGIKGKQSMQVYHPALGSLKEIGIPVHLAMTPGTVREPAPQLGQHTEEILLEMLGYTRHDIDILRAKRIIR